GQVARGLAGEPAPDRELLDRYLDGRDEAAFAVLVRRHARLVRSAAGRVLSEPADVDDATQATFLVLIRRARSVNWHAGLGPWLSAVCHRVAVRLRARCDRRPDPLGESEPPDPAPPADPSYRAA